MFSVSILIFRPGTAAKVRLLVQHELNILRALGKHGLQPSLIVYWAKSLLKTVSRLLPFLANVKLLFKFVQFMDLNAQMFRLIQ